MIAANRRSTPPPETVKLRPVSDTEPTPPFPGRAHLDRRSFLKTSALAAGAIGFPSLSLGQGVGAANSRLNIAMIGAGGVASMAYDALEGKENIVALCDVHDYRAAEAYERFPKARRFKDFRVMFDKMGKEIDAVVISTPDHTHFVATLTAMGHGKHVYTQKPLTHNVWQARTLQKAKHYYKVVTQMGNQGHATEGIRYIREWYEAGAIGEVREVLAWFDGPDFTGKYFAKPSQFPAPEAEIPASLDWDLWLGPAADRPFSRTYLPLTWRSWYDFGCGELGDWACHTLDGPYWALELGQPTVVEPVLRPPTPEGFVSDRSIIRFEFPARGDKPPVTLSWYDGFEKPAIRPEWEVSELTHRGMIMVGETGSIMTYGRPDSPWLLPETKWLDFRRNLPAKTIPRIKGGPFTEWADAIKGDGPEPGSNFDYSAGLTEMSLLGVLAQRFSSRIEYDAANMRITNRPELNAFIREPARPGWEMGDELWR